MSFDKDKILSKAQKLIQQGKIPKAIEEYQKIVETDPSDVRTELKIGDLFAKIGNIEAACDTYKKVAEHYAKDGFFLKAIAVFKQILKLDPGLIKVYARLAELYNQLGLNSEAMKQYQVIVKHYENKGMKKESLDILQKMAELDPDNVASKVKLAELYAKEGFGDQAVDQFKNVAKDLKEKNNFEDLIKVLEKMTSMNPGDTDNMLELSSIYLKVGEPKKALAKLQVCFKTGPKEPRTLELLAQAFVDLQQPEKAKSVYRELTAVFEEQGKLEEKEKLALRMKEVLPEESYQVSSSSSLAEKASEEKEDVLLKVEEGEEKEAAPESSSKVVSEVDVYAKYGLFDKAIDALVRGLESIADKEPLRKRLSEIVEKDGSNAAVQKAIKSAAERLKNDGNNDLAVLVEKIARGEKVAAKAKAPEVEEVVEEVEEVLLDEASMIEDGEPEPKAEAEEVSINIGIEPSKETPSVSKIEFPEEVSVKKATKGPSVEISDGLEQEMLREESPSQEMEISSFDVKPDEVSKDDVVSLSNLEPPSSEHVPKESPIPKEEPPRKEPLESAAKEARRERPKPSSPLDKYRDELEEAEFFVKQGLLEEAKYIYESVLEALPDSSEVRVRLNEIEELLSRDIKSKIKSRSSVDIAPPPKAIPQSIMDDGSLFDLGKELESEIKEISKAMAISQDEPVLTFDEMFLQFKKGVETSLSKDDFQAHYDLGVAYKEMGLLDDAIGEFKISMKEAKLKLPSLSMIGLCFISKGDFDNAIKSFEMGLSLVDRSSEEGLSFAFDMADALVKKGDIQAGLKLLNEIRAKRPAFRNVTSRISEIESLAAKKAKPSSAVEAGDESKDESEKGEGEEDDKKDKISYI